MDIVDINGEKVIKRTDPDTGISITMHFSDKDDKEIIEGMKEVCRKFLTKH